MPSTDEAMKCRRCEGIGHTDIDILPGLPHERCHRCNGCGIEPPYLRSWAAWEIEYRRQATAAGTPLDLQDSVIEMLARMRA